MEGWSQQLVALYPLGEFYPMQVRDSGGFVQVKPNVGMY